MKSFSSTVVLCLLAFGSARAQRFELSPFVAHLGVYTGPLGSVVTNSSFKNTDTTIRSEQPFYGVRVTFNTHGYWGHEFGYAMGNAKMNAVIRTTDAAGNVSERTVQDRIKVRYGFYNFMMYFMPAGERWRPYVTAGFQTFNYGAANFPEWDQGSWRNYGINWGGGIKLKPVEHLLFRIDVRDYIHGKPYGLQPETGTTIGGLTHDWEGSVGIAITF